MVDDTPPSKRPRPGEGQSSEDEEEDAEPAGNLLPSLSAAGGNTVLPLPNELAGPVDDDEDEEYALLEAEQDDED